ncbi:MAG: N-acetylmuramoyl-L-alanine amidase [Acidimicrobiales bacterium]|jgi:hypothetical protein|nr:N-acetylmuramoyl-L-alanine amidase [Acidimicrobiales bacterium]
MAVRTRILSFVAVSFALLASVPLTGAAQAAEAHPIRFPVDGPVHYISDFGAPRPGGRTHQGNDLMGTKLEHEVAAADGVITYVHNDGDGGISGNMLILSAVDGWSYYYIHINNDTPGTDDGRNPPEWRYAPGIRVGSRVLAGQFIAYLGDSGDAETTAPHLHFEVHPPKASPSAGAAIDPYPSLQAATRGPSPVVAGGAANPNGGAYVVETNGAVHAFGGALNYGSDVLPLPLAKSIAVMPDGLGYVVLDGWGGLHLFGSARVALAGMTGGYWPGWDIARSLAITPSGHGLAVLDGFGGVHRAGDAPGLASNYQLGTDIFRGLAFTPTGKGGYVLDGWGHVTASGDAISGSTPSWPGWDIARAIAVTKSGNGFAVLDGWGGVHPVGDAPPAPAESFEPGSSWRSLSIAGTRYVLARNDGLSGTWVG